MKSVKRLHLSFALALLGAFSFQLITARAQSQVVTNTSDAGPGSLRDAINNAPNGGFIYFATNLSGATITLTSGQLLVTNNLTIDASALSNAVTISGNTNSRVFFITNNATVVLNSLTLANGRPPQGATNSLGGGIYNSTNCTLTAIRCLVLSNSAAGDGGDGDDNSGFGNGGGIYNAGTLTLDHCTLSGNSAPGGSVMWAASCGGDGNGGALYNAGAATLGYCLVSSNSASGGANGTGYTNTLGVAGGSGYGGGIYNAGTATLGYCTVSRNSASGGDAGTNLYLDAGTGGNSSGGGVYNGGTLTVSNCTLSDNIGRGGSGANAKVGSGGYFTTSGGSANGGGICNAGTLTLDQSTLLNNSLTGGHGGLGGNGPQGGIIPGGSAAGGGVYDAGIATLTHDTISSNFVIGGLNGPSNSRNHADGGGVYNTGTNATLHNCLIAKNLYLSAFSTGPDLSGTFVSLGHNLIGATNGSGGISSGVNGDLAGTTSALIDPLLMSLANNGGPTFTMALQTGSPAIDAGDDSVTNTLATDQRGAGFPRRAGQHVDIGAYELGAGGSIPGITSLNAGSVTLDPISHLGSLSVGASVNPNAIDTTAGAWVQYGVSTSYGLTTTSLGVGAGANYVPLTFPLTNLAPGLMWHYRWVATNALGTNFSPDQTVAIGTPGGGATGIVGDLDGDGIVSQAELNAVYANYVTNSPWLYMTNVAGLGGTNVTFSLSNSVLGAYSIQVSTNLVNWDYLGPARPRYLFTDTNAPAVPTRYYRLSYP
jgi:hypothetical protein